MVGADRLTRQAVVDKAIEVADADGLGAVTVRRLAQELGVTPMALYWHFKNKELLLNAVADHVLAEVTPEPDPSSPWADRLRIMAEALTTVLRRHPAMTGLFPALHKHQVDSFSRATEAALGMLSEAGFSLEEGYLISSYLLNGVIALVETQQVGSVGMTPEERAECRRQKRLSLEALPPDRFPCMVAFGRALDKEPDADAYYAFGIDLLLGGVEAMAAQRTPSTATQSSAR
ncbi:TetR family transcriptional regulator [Microbispora sp. NPDC049125]|uniref:TetR family transcriptional regulator n=1 Tax=Microbispora sp. NPDC049125 TaxID=3154929 RepID=UPI003465DA8C